MSRTLNQIERDILAGLGPKDRILALLRSRAGLEARDFAIQRGVLLSQVYQTLRGTTPGETVRDALAETMAVTRAEIDRLIDGEAAAATADTPVATS